MTAEERTGDRPVKVFPSYSWDSSGHQQWIKDLCARLRGAGIEVCLDVWGVQPGDQLTHFMEREIRASDFVICICTPRYKEKFDAREGGAGYEANLMSSEAFATGNERKFFALLREGDRVEALPSWLLGKRFLDFRGNPYREESFEELLATLLGFAPQAPAVRLPAADSATALSPTSVTRQEKYAQYVNAALKLFEFGNQRFVLREHNNDASRLLMRGVEQQLDDQEKRFNALLQEFHLLSSEEVLKAAGSVFACVLESRISSMLDSMKPKFDDAYQRFLREALPGFRKAVREEAGLR